MSYSTSVFKDLVWIVATTTKAAPPPPRPPTRRTVPRDPMARSGYDASAPSIFRASWFDRWVVTHSLADSDFHSDTSDIRNVLDGNSCFNRVNNLITFQRQGCITFKGLHEWLSPVYSGSYFNPQLRCSLRVVKKKSLAISIEGEGQHHHSFLIASHLLHHRVAL